MAELKTVSLDKIHVPEVRVSSILNPEQQALMTSTIKEIGVVQDIIVRDLGTGQYELVAGKSRLEELRKLGVLETQVKVIGADEKLALIMNIVENVARGTYDYISIAKTIRKLRSLGSTPEELERVFPWKRRWIQFIEDLQDLPDDVQEGLATRKITPTHVQLALNLPTPHEVHDGLRTAMTHEWDTGTFTTFVQNRVEQISRARAAAAKVGVEPEIPPPEPEQLIKYKQCLLCGYKKPADQVNVQLICDGCRDLAGYVTSLEGPPEEAIKTVYAAFQAYYGTRPAPMPQAPPAGVTTPPAAPETPPPPGFELGAQDLSFMTFDVLQKLRFGSITRDVARGYLLTLGLSPAEVERYLATVK